MRILTTTLLSMAAIALLALAVDATAQDDEFKQEIKAAKLRVKELLKKAEKLEDKGSHEDAAELRKMAKELAGRIESALDKRKPQNAKKKKAKRDRKASGGETMRGLQAGINALERIGGQDEVIGHLKELLAEMKSKRGRGQKKSARDDGAARKIRTLRTAMHALLEHERRDAAHQIERAIHAMELRASGRRGKEAKEVMKRAPGNGQMAELLTLASRLLKESKKKEWAKAVGGLAEQYMEVAQKERRHRKDDRRAGDEDRRREVDIERNRDRRFGPDRGRGGPLEMRRVMERLEKLEGRLDQITRLMERMLKEREHK